DLVSRPGSWQCRTRCPSAVAELPGPAHHRRSERMTSVYDPERIDIPSATQDTDGYVRALLEVAGEREPCTVLGTTPARARLLLQDLPDGLLDAPPAPDEWSAATVVGHLYDVDIVYGFRWRLVLTEDHPDYPGYDEKSWAGLPRLPFWQLFNA